MVNNVLVTGGSGFIGTVVCKMLVADGYNVINLDRIKKDIEGVTQYVMDLCDTDTLEELMVREKIESVIHLAAEHEVGRSMKDPGLYYHNNVSNTIGLLNTMNLCGVKNFVFSSSSSVYGDANVFPTPEVYHTNPQSPYARSKAIIENILYDYYDAYQINSNILRYFNAAGAMPDMSHGYTQDPPSHLIPMICKALVKGDRFEVYGDNYPTQDGTCERDYTHVCDIARAHIMSLKPEGINIFNLGLGSPASVLDVTHVARKVTGKDLIVNVGFPRRGDVVTTCADNTKARKELLWEPKYTLEDIIKHAYEWEIKQWQK